MMTMKMRRRPWVGVPMLIAVLLMAGSVSALDVKVGGDRGKLTVNTDTEFADISSLQGVTIFDGSIAFNKGVCDNLSYNNLLTAFGAIREVRGSLELNFKDITDDSCVPDLGFFANLRVIRGIGARGGSTSLSISADADAPKSFGLKNLRMVAQNDISIDGERPSAALCGKGRIDDPSFEGANLTALVPGIVTSVEERAGKLTFTMDSSGTDVTVEYVADPILSNKCPLPFCHASCNGTCWGRGEDECQTVCTASCGRSGCYEEAPGQCCPEECLGGCTASNGALLCHACEDGYLITPNGTCIADDSQCPEGSYPAGYINVDVCGGGGNRFRRALSHFYCSVGCMGNVDDSLAIENGTCVDFCFGGRPANATTNECIPLAPGLEPYKPCLATTHVIDRCTARLLADEDCDTLFGSIRVTAGKSGEREGSLAFASEKEFAILSKIRRVLGTVSVAQSPIVSLDVLRNIEFIEAQPAASLDSTALTISLNGVLRTLPLASLRSVPSVLFRLTPNLCYHYSTVDWAELGATPSFQDIPPSFFGFDRPINPLEYPADFRAPIGSLPPEHPACESRCHSLCRPSKCWGPGIDDCQRCPDDRLLHQAACLAKGESCPVGFYSNSWSCRPCHSTCAACDGPLSTQCTACEGSRFFKDGECVLGCDERFFANATTNTCDSCDPLCLQCTGPNSNECAECHSGFSLRPWDQTCTPVGTCPIGYYSDLSTKTCTECQDHCRQCIANAAGASPPTLCLQPESGYFVLLGYVYPIDTCKPGSEYELVPPTNTSNRVCADLSSCTIDEEYISQSATPTSDVVCGNCTRCDPVTEVRRQGAGSCDGVNDAICVLIDVCLSRPCGNGGACTSINGTTRECNCTGTGFCGESCVLELVDGVCGPTSASSSASDVFTYVGVAAGAVVLFVLLIVVALRVRERVYSVYKPDKMIRAKRAITDAWEIDRDLLTIGRVIGEGQFGRVSRGLLQQARGASMTDTPAQDVGIKQLKGNANGTQEEDEFFKEMALMKSLGRHRHVLSLVGVCTLDDPILLVVEFAELGDLKNYLRDRRPSETQPECIFEDDKIDFAAQVASGMAFLSNNKIVHRDLAARNVLVASGKVLKVSDFGLARDVAGEDMYQKKSAGKIAFKWMAPECINDRVFTSSSDVWSFGITLWEIVTLAKMPYPGLSNYEVVQQLQEGYRMPCPDECSQELYQIMRRCWIEFPEQRPSFMELVGDLAKLIDKTADDYVDVGAGDKPNLMSEAVLERLKEDSDRAYLIPTLQRDQVPELAEGQAQNGDGYMQPSLQRMETLDEGDEEGLGYVDGVLATSFEEDSAQGAKETRMA